MTQTVHMPNRESLTPSSSKSTAAATRASWQSTFIWILICLIVFDCFLVGIRPLQYIKIRGLVPADQQPLNDKLEFLHSTIVKPDMLILGSSLPMHTCFGADWLAAGKPLWPANYLFRHTGTRCFSDLLNKALGVQLTGYNVGVSAAMISDDSIILKNILDQGIKPKLIVLMVAPKDFVDNLAQPAGKSRYFNFFNERKNGIQISVSKSLAENTEAVLNYCWRYFKVRADYSRTLEFIVCSFFGRAATFYNAATGRAYTPQMLKDIEIGTSPLPYTDPPPPSVIYGDLDVYKRRYLPFDEKRLALEISYLHDLLADCKAKGMMVLVVGMPLHPENRKLLPPPQKQALYSAIENTCRSGSATFINMIDSDSYAANDFSDSVHMRAEASLRFFNQLTAELAKDTDFSQRLSQAMTGVKKRISSPR